MSDHGYSIADAKAQFADLVNQAQTCGAVRITRRGKPVAVLVSELEYERLQGLDGMKGGWVAFNKAWRKTMAAQKLDFVSDAELQGLRNTTARPATDLA